VAFAPIPAIAFYQSTRPHCVLARKPAPRKGECRHACPSRARPHQLLEADRRARNRKNFLAETRRRESQPHRFRVPTCRKRREKLKAVPEARCSNEAGRAGAGGAPSVRVCTTSSTGGVLSRINSGRTGAPHLNPKNWHSSEAGLLSKAPDSKQKEGKVASGSHGAVPSDNYVTGKRIAGQGDVVFLRATVRGQTQFPPPPHRGSELSRQKKFTDSKVLGVGALIYLSRSRISQGGTPARIDS